MTKTRKKLLAILLPGGVLVLAGAIALALWLTAKPEVEKPFLILRDQNTNEIVSCTLKEECRVEDTPLPLTAYTLQVPQGWVQTVDAMDSANQYSPTYQDRFVLEETQEDFSPVTLTFSQKYAAMTYELGATQEVMYGDQQLLYRSGRTGSEEDTGTPYTELSWIYGQSYLTIRCQQDRDVNQMLELFVLVDYHTPRQPNYSPLELVRDDLDADVEFLTLQGYRTQGNPELPDGEAAEVPGFAVPPEGWTLIETEVNTQDEYGLFSAQYTYQNQAGKLLRLSAAAGSNDLFQSDYPFAAISFEELNTPQTVQQVDLAEGKEAFVHINPDQNAWEMGWAEGYWTVQLRSTAPLTQQELIALAKSVLPAEALPDTSPEEEP